MEKLTNAQAKRRNYLYLKHTLRIDDWLSKSFSTYLSRTNPSEVLVSAKAYKVGRVCSVEGTLSSGKVVSKKLIEGLPLFL